MIDLSLVMSMKNRILGFILGLSAVIMLIVGSCSVIRPLNTEQIVKYSHDGVVKMVRVMHFADGTTAEGSCTAFLIGHEQLLTAAHCFDPLYLLFHEDELLSSVVKKEFEHTIIDLHGHEFTDFRILKYNIEHDLVLMEIKGFHGESLSMWNPTFDGEPQPGSEIIALGYPGYFATQFSFEKGLLKAIGRIPTGFGSDGPFIISMGTLFPGYSGGPTVAASNGKVIGLNHAGAVIATFRGINVNLSLAISYDTILRFLADSGDEEELVGTRVP